MAVGFNQTREIRIRNFILQALADYRNDINNISAGYAILRYAKLGYLSVDRHVDPDIFLEWYPLDQSYVLLRLAQQGRLLCKVPGLL